MTDSPQTFDRLALDVPATVPLTAARTVIGQSTETMEPRVVEDFERALRATGVQALRNVEVALWCGRIILSGIVATYYEKQLAQAVIGQRGGARNWKIDNRLHVTGCAR